MLTNYDEPKLEVNRKNSIENTIVMKWMRGLCLYCIAYATFALCSVARPFFTSCVNLFQSKNDAIYYDIRSDLIRNLLTNAVMVLFFIILIVSLGMLLSSLVKNKNKINRKLFSVSIILFVVSQLKYVFLTILNPSFDDGQTTRGIGEWLPEAIMTLLFVAIFLFLAIDCRKISGHRISRILIILSCLYILYISVVMFFSSMRIADAQFSANVEWDFIIINNLLKNVGKLLFSISYCVILNLAFWVMLPTKSIKAEK